MWNSQNFLIIDYWDSIDYCIVLLRQNNYSKFTNFWALNFLIFETWNVQLSIFKFSYSKFLYFWIYQIFKIYKIV